MANPIKIQARIESIQVVGKGAYHLFLSTEKRLPRFKAGQFTHLTVEPFDPSDGFWPESRVFSIASSPENRNLLELVYSVKGEYTQKMEKNLSEGLEVWLKLPYGDFIVDNFLSPGQTAVFIAGGTGIAPFIPYLIKYSGEEDLCLAYGLRSIDFLLFFETLKEVSENDKFHLDFFLENLEGSHVCASIGKVNEGLLSIPDILEITSSFPDRVYFLSGPPVMIEKFKNQLIESGVNKENVKIDEWG